MPVVFYVDAALQLTAQRLPLLDQAGAGVNETPPVLLVPDGNTGPRCSSDVSGGAQAPGT